ncbi:MAG: acetate kinase [Gammaproteobacteria bacterium]|nr:acetate kinase [Gammaproteobacteria bacterium]
MNLLVINCGSSSIKFKLFTMPEANSCVAGQLDGIGTAAGRFRFGVETAAKEVELYDATADLPDHQQALTLLFSKLQQQPHRIEAVAHRVVHGGTAFSGATLIDAATLPRIAALAPLAPLHNPINLLGIAACSQFYPELPQVAVFDTAFHQTLPEVAYRYAIPEGWYRDYQIRRYGFHGISHAYVAAQAADFLGLEGGGNLITLHLGTGASMAAIREGRCVDTSMGLTPLAGLVMGSRCGDIDPAIPYHLQRVAGLSAAAVDAALNQQSGLRGLCGESDMREIEVGVAAGNATATLALQIYCYQIRKTIGAYFAVLGRVDALIFTAGVGENSAVVRQAVCAELAVFGIALDAQRNLQCRGDIREIQSSTSRLPLLVIATDEELAIARESHALLAV